MPVNDQNVIYTKFTPDISERISALAARHQRSLASTARYLTRLGLAVVDGDFVNAPGLSDEKKALILSEGMIGSERSV